MVELRPLRLDEDPGYEQSFEQLHEGGWLWVLEELSFVWQEAQLEASRAYSHWCRMRDRTSYSIYRAAQDRADAAQDALSARHAAEQAGEAPEGLSPVGAAGTKTGTKPLAERRSEAA